MGWRGALTPQGILIYDLARIAWVRHHKSVTATAATDPGFPTGGNNL